MNLRIVFMLAKKQFKETKNPQVYCKHATKSDPCQKGGPTLLFTLIAYHYKNLLSDWLSFVSVDRRNGQHMDF
jgi:hypothetical protein